MQARGDDPGDPSASLNILLVDEDASLTADLAAGLRALGYRVVVTGDGRHALTLMVDDTFDAMILERLLPGINGIDMVERLRGGGVTVPVIFVTTLDRTAEKIEGLNAGADDYLAKPVGVDELDARIRALLRGRRWARGEADTIRVGDIVVSPTKFRAWRNGRVIDMPTAEFELLAELARNADAVMTRAALIERIWGEEVGPDARIVDTYIRRLRARLTADGGDDPIATVRGVGYSLKG